MINSHKKSLIAHTTIMQRNFSCAHPQRYLAQKYKEMAEREGFEPSIQLPV